MRIAYYSDVFLPKVDGVVTSLMALAQEMGKRKHAVAVFCPNPGRGREINWSASGVSLFPVASVPTFYPDLRMAAPNPVSWLRLKRFKPQVIHIHSPGPLGVEGLVGGRTLKVPIVGTFNTYFMEPEYLRLVKLDKYKKISEAVWKFGARFYGRCDMITSPSSQAISDLREHGVERPMRVIPNGIDLSFVDKVKAKEVKKIKREYGLGERVVLYVGRLSKEKSLDVLLAAFAKLSEEMPEAQLVIVGDGPIRKELEEESKDLGIDDQVRFVGLVEHEELLESGLLQAALVFCTASTSEVQPMSVIEAMAAGLPIVGVSARGMKELVDGNGELVEPGDVEGIYQALALFLKFEEKRKLASQWSRLRSKQFSIENVREMMEDIYQLLVNQGRDEAGS